MYHQVPSPVYQLIAGSSVQRWMVFWAFRPAVQNEPDEWHKLSIK